MNAPAITPWTGLTAAEYHARLARDGARKPSRFRVMTEGEAEAVVAEEIGDEIGARASAYYGGTQAGRR